MVLGQHEDLDADLRREEAMVLGQHEDLDVGGEVK
jgi:hypothetical protein